VGLFFWATYWFLGAQEMVNYADANDLILAALDLGLAHPPGYPLYIWLLHGWITLLSFLSWMNPTMAATGLSALFMGLSVGSVFGLVVDVGRRWLSSLEAILWGIAAAGMVGLHPLLWKLALVPEVMTLSVWLVVLAVWLALRIWFYEHVLLRELVLFSVVAMTGVLHHLLVLPLMGAFFVVVWWKLRRWKQVYLMLLGAVAALLITAGLYAGLAIFSSGYGWEVPNTLLGWWQFWSRQVYTTEGSAIELFSADGRLDLMVLSVWKWAHVWFIDWWGGFGLVGLMVWLVLFRKNRTYVWFAGGVLLSFLIYGPGVAAYVRHPEVYSVSETGLWWGMALRERMFYPLALVEVVTLFGGVVGIWRLLVHLSYRGKALFFGVLLVVGGWVYVSNWESLQLRGGNSAWVYVREVLTQIPSGGVLLVDSDEVFSLLYGQKVMGYGSLVTVLPTRMILEHNAWLGQVDTLTQNGFSTNTRGFVADLTSTSLSQGKRVFFYGMDSSILEFVGTEGNPYFGTPFGYVLEVTASPQDSTKTFDYGLSVQLASLKTESADYWFKGFRTHLAEIHAQHAYLLARMGNEETVVWHERVASDLVYEPYSRDIITSSTHLGWERYRALGNYMTQEQLPVEWWLSRAQEAYALRQFTQAAYALERAMLLDRQAVFAQVDPRGIWIAAYGKEVVGQHPMWFWK
jgi:hypothetical protein